jgi:hypothetical protein
VEHKNNSKAIWNLMNNLLGRSYSSSSDIAITDPNKLNLFFANLGFNTVKHLSHSGNFKNYLRGSYMNSFYMSSTLPQEIVSIVNTLNNKSSVGFDNISTKLLRHIVIPLANPLSHIVNQSFLTGNVPNKLKIARVIPLYKNGDKSKLTNYRPISILPSISKIFERAVINRLNKYLQQHSILNNSQHGFRSSHNVNTAITVALNYITDALNNKDFCMATFLESIRFYRSYNIT